MKKIKFKDIINGQFVFDKDNIEGMVIDSSDIHNVDVKYLNGGRGLYCLDKKDKEYDPLYIKRNEKK